MFSRSAAALLASGLLMLAGCGGLGFADEAGSTLGGRSAGEAGSTFVPRFQLPPRDTAPPEAGSALAPRFGLPPREAGSSLAPPRRTTGFDRGEAGSTLRPRDSRFGEAGSGLSPRRLGPAREPREAGSLLVGPRRTDRAPEAGSALYAEAGSVLVRRRVDGTTAGNGSQFSLIDHDTGGGSPMTLVSRKRPTPLALVLIALAGSALILWTLFRAGMSNPYARELWTRRLDLCCDLAGQLDTFMDAVRREDWDRCQAMLDALHATNGRRAVLLSNSTNSALFRFLQVAINCRLSAREPEYRRNLENKFALAVESLRKASRQSELLSLENRQFLVDANKSYRSLRDRV